MELSKTLSNSIPFKNFLFKEQKHRTILWISLGLIVIQFSVFKYFYPYASFIHDDSFEYLATANENLDVNFYMIGYGRFLRMFSALSNSDTILVAFQFLGIQCSALFFVFTIFYFYNPGKIVQIILLFAMVLNPLFLHLANLISSDCLFASLSLIWFSLLIWIINRHSVKIILWHAVVLFLAFTVRYNALIYPFISVGILLFTKLPLGKKIVGIGACLLLCGSFVVYTSHKYKELTGYWQYSPFSGWQLANNALYVYRYVEQGNRKEVPLNFKQLDNMVRKYFDSTRDVSKYPIEGIMASTFYMWSRGLPLMKYRDNIFKNDTSVNDFKKWASMGPFYQEYGLYIIKKYPVHFIRYFLWPNLNRYYAPPVEFLGMYNSGKNEVPELAKNWFRYKNLKVRTRFKDNNTWVLDLYPILSGFFNVLMLCTIVCFTLLKGWRNNREFTKGVLLGGCFWLLNALFSTGASSAALRFQSFPIQLTITFSLLLVDWMVQVMKTIQSQSTNTTSNYSHPNHIDEPFRGNVRLKY